MQQQRKQQRNRERTSRLFAFVMLESAGRHWRAEGAAGIRSGQGRQTPPGQICVRHGLRPFADTRRPDEFSGGNPSVG
jgi:hypothetical protein